MESSHNLFYSEYLREFHKVKSIWIKSHLENLELTNQQIAKYDHGMKISDRTEIILRMDMRMNYLHAIETFFELFFALSPNTSGTPTDERIVRSLSQSDWNGNYKRISEIASGDFDISKFLSKEVKYCGHKISFGHYLFYAGILSKSKFPKEVFNWISESLEAIPTGIKSLAKDFSDRNEYNAYKHGLRIFPAHKTVYFMSPEQSDPVAEFDLKNSVSFHQFRSKDNSIVVRTKLLDTERDFKMTAFAANLIHNLIFFRNLVHRNKKQIDKKEKVAIGFFGKDEVYECTRHNVEIQDLSFTSKEQKGL